MWDANLYAVWVAELAGSRIAGWIAAYVSRSIELDAFIEITGLVVDKKVRSRGVGKLLLQAAEEWAMSCCCQVITVRCNVKRRRAHRFYGMNGYEWTKTQKSFRKIVTRRATLK
jgi:GNAT superfamily N-acetyltransferase